MIADIRPIRNEADYGAALSAYEAYFDNEPELGSPEGDCFELLGMVLAKYEEEHFPFAAPDPVETIKLVMEGRGLSKSDLAKVLGSAPRATEVLQGRRGLSMEHVRRLHREWRIPAEALIGEMADAGAS